MGPPFFFGRQGAPAALILLFWIVFYAWLLAELWIGWRYRIRAGSAARDRGSRTLLIASVWLGVALGIGLSFTPPSVVGPLRDVLLALGIAAMLAGVVLRWSAIRTLGQSFTTAVAVRAEQAVVERGLYRWIRHPSYTGGLLTVVGCLIACANIASLAAIVIPVLGYLYRMRVEEQALVAGLGEPYIHYMQRTKRLIPFIV